MRYKSFLVVGGAGFFGSHIVDELVAEKAEKVVVIDNLFLGKLENLEPKRENVHVYREDARYLSALENILMREKCETVVNCAVKCLPYGFIDPEGAFMTGVEITLNLANLLRKGVFKRLLHISSSEAYGTAETTVMTENHRLQPTSPYGAGKAAADLLLQSYHKLFGIEATILRPFNMYGPRQNMDAYAALIPVTISRILSGQQPILEGDGEQSRDFSYVKDVTSASIKLLDCDKALGKVVNIASGTEIKIKDVIRTVCDILNYPQDNVIHVPARHSDVRRLCGGIRLAKQFINYEPHTNFEKGIQKTVDWYKQNCNLERRDSYA